MDTAPNPPIRTLRQPPVTEGKGDMARPQDRIDDFTLIGPSPAFQANVLDIERDLKRAIDALEAARGRLEAETAFRVGRNAPPPVLNQALPQPEAEAESPKAKATSTTPPATDLAPQGAPDPKPGPSTGTGRTA